MNDIPIKRISTYRDLKVWQKAMDLVVVCYALTKGLPDYERFGLASQIQRSSVSIPANIAEGHGRHHLGDKLHHLSVANGSLKELETHLLLAERLKYLNAVELKLALEQSDQIGKMLTVLMQKLRARR